MKNKSFTILILVSIIIFTVITHIKSMGHNYDDWSSYRSSAYLSSHTNPDIIKNIHSHLNTNRNIIGEFKYNRYKMRLKVYNTYTLNNVLINFFEKIPTNSAYQSVFLAKTIIHLFSILCLFSIVILIYDKYIKMLNLFFLLTSSVEIVNLKRLFPFHHVGYIWYTSSLRGASFIFWCCSILLFSMSSKSISKSTRYTLSVLFFILSLLAHFATPLILTIVLISIYITYLITKSFPSKILSNMSVIKNFILYNSIVLIIFTLKLAFLIGMKSHIDYSISHMIKQNCLTFFWLAEANLLIFYKIQKNNTDDNISSNILNYFIGFSILSIGLSSISSANKIANLGLMSNLDRISVRILAVSHMLWWLLFIDTFKEKLDYLAKRNIITICAMCFIFTTQLNDCRRIDTNYINNKELLNTKISNLLKRDHSIYDRPDLYFNAIANELKGE